MPRIELINVSKRWGSFVGVDHLNMVIEDNEFITLLGPSGCGKTTTLRMIAGLETPTEGKIIIGDTVVFDSETGINVSPAKRDIGFLFQNYALWPHMTVYKNIAFGLENLQWSKEDIDARVDEVCKMLKVEQFKDRYPAELSGGQQQRVAIARTLAPRPKVLFMDEPLSNLDAKLRGEMRTELKRLHTDTGSTFVYVTHDQLEAMTLATRICLIETGVLQQYDPPLTVYNKPANLFVADFVGNPTMNFIESKAEVVDAHTVKVDLYGVPAVFHAKDNVLPPSEEEIAEYNAKLEEIKAQAEAKAKEKEAEDIELNLRPEWQENADVKKNPTNRKFLKIFLLSLVTFGIYGLIEAIRVVGEMGRARVAHGKSRSMPVGWLILWSFLSFGIVPLVWGHKFTNRLKNELKYRGIDNPGVATWKYWVFYVVLSETVVFPILFLLSVIKAVNAINEHHNKYGDVMVKPDVKVDEQREIISLPKLREGLTGDEVVIGIRPEFLDINSKGKVEGKAFAALPAGMETTVKISLGDSLLSAVKFGSVNYEADEVINFDIAGEGIILFDKASRRNVSLGSIEVTK